MYTYYYILDDTYYKITGEQEYKCIEHFYNLGQVYAENLNKGNSFDFQMTHATPFRLYVTKEVFK